MGVIRDTINHIKSVGNRLFGNHIDQQVVPDKEEELVNIAAAEGVDSKDAAELIGAKRRVDRDGEKRNERIEGEISLNRTSPDERYEVNAKDNNGRTNNNVQSRNRESERERE